jgi:8-oxo-dGTP diphosphatase
MLQLNKRPCAEDKLLGVSTHNLTEALKAQSIGADFVVISPVQARAKVGFKKSPSG